MTTGYMFDAANWQEMPANALIVAHYYNGLYAVSREQIADTYRDAQHIYAIDVLGNAAEACSIADVETGDMTVSDVFNWANDRYAAHPGIMRIYCNLSTWPSVKVEVAKLNAGIRKNVRYWIANPTGTPHMVPGASATQYYWGNRYDQSQVNLEAFCGS